MAVNQPREADFGAESPFPTLGRTGVLVLSAIAGFGVCLWARVSAPGLVDYPLTRLVNLAAGRSTLFDMGVQTLNSFTLFKGVAVYALVFGAFATASREDRFKLALGCVAAAAAAAASRLLQVAMPHSPRPRLDPDFVFTAPAGITRSVVADWSSFPSDHAALLFAVAVSLFVVNRAFGLAALAVATVIGLARVYIGLHYPTDVIGGALIGAAFALAAMSCAGRVQGLRAVRALERRPAVLAAFAFFLAAQSADMFDEARQIASGVADQLTN